jgi:hypothetical protein
MEHLTSPPPQAAVLRQLLSRRHSTPGEPVDDALAETWKAAGRPDFSGVPLLPPLDSWPDDAMPPLALDAKSSPQARLVFASSPPTEQLRLALEAAEQARTNPLPVNLEILAVLMPGESVPPSEEARRAAERVGRLVIDADPTNGYLALAAWLATGSETDPVTESDLATLEAALGKPRFEVPRRAVFEQLRTMAARVDPQHADLRARGASLGTPVVVFRLWQRAESTKDADARRRAGLVMGAIASRFACSGTILERMLGAALARKGADLAGSSDQLAIHRAQDAIHAWRSAMTEAQRRLGTWPFAASLRNLDVTREVARYERLAGPFPTSPLPAFSCRANAVPGVGKSQ